MSIIHILFSTDLPTRKQNELCYRMEMAQWKERLRIARENNDYEEMDRLQIDYERVGLP